MADLHEMLLKRAERAFSQMTIGQAWESRRAIIGTANMPAGEEQQLAEEALETLRLGGKPSAPQLAALELAIRLMRPAPLSKRGSLDDLPEEAASSFQDWPAFQKSVTPFLYSIGRIDQFPEEAVGTGFLISDKLLVTNRHVLSQLSRGTEVLEQGQAVVRFKHEYQSPDEPPVAIKRVVAVHPALDMALLEVEKKDYNDGRLPLAIDPAEVEEGHPVVAIGYPFNDSVRNPLFISTVFGARFGVKRAAPGEVTGVAANSIFHDCSTLGGNSGSPILSMKTSRLVGIHRDGRFMYRNEAANGASVSEFVTAHLNQ
jgi:endonuclease G